MKFIAAALFALLAPSLAQAQDAPACTAQSTIASAANSSGLDRALLAPGQMTAVTLHPAGNVTFPLQPEKPGAPQAYGGLVAITIAQAGTWRIGLSSGAWIDVVQNGAAIASAAHGHGAGCLHKMVDFPLAAGRAILQISANADPSLTMTVSPAP